MLEVTVPTLLPLRQIPRPVTIPSEIKRTILFWGLFSISFNKASLPTKKFFSKSTAALKRGAFSGVCSVSYSLPIKGKPKFPADIRFSSRPPSPTNNPPNSRALTTIFLKWVSATSTGIQTSQPQRFVQPVRLKNQDCPSITTSLKVKKLIFFSGLFRLAMHSFP